MKTKSSIKNSLISTFQYIILMIIGFVSQKIFINILGIDFLGLNSLLTNIMSLLGIAELGIGSAIIYNLYKPIVNKDYKTINSLMHFYKKAYHVIAIIIFITGFIFMPFISFFVDADGININIYYAYILFLFDIVASYFLSYKRSILYADQKNYIVNIIHIISVTLLNVFQLLFLYLTKDYYTYLIFKIIFRVVENCTITLYVNRKYKDILSSKAEILDKDIYNDIVKKVKALFFHKIAGFVVNGTDNIVISCFLGLTVVGLYSNYYLVIYAVSTLFGEAFNALTPSIGHLLVENDKHKNYEVFKKIRFMNFIIACFSSVILMLIMENFVTIWLGKDYLLSTVTLIVLVFNLYQKMMRNTYLSFKNAAGIFYEDRYMPILESITNIIVSVILVIIIGLPGVFLGTIISGLWLWLYSYPKYVYEVLFDRKKINYYKETFSYILLFSIILIISILLAKVYSFNNIYLEILKNTLIAFIIPLIIIFVLFRKNDSYKYYKDMLKKYLKINK